MAKTKKAQSALPYARRLLEDEYVQEQLRNAAQGLRTVYERARKERGKATEDKHLYGNLRHAATSIRNAATALQRPKPKPKKRRARKLAAFGFAVGGCAWLVMWLQKQQTAANPPGDLATEPGAPAAAAGGSQRAPEPAATGSPPPD
jgi:ferric-dicitrate binding protein FerR (iron transport regulator)